MGTVGQDEQGAMKLCNTQEKQGQENEHPASQLPLKGSESLLKVNFTSVCLSMSFFRGMVLLYSPGTPDLPASAYSVLG